MEPSPSQPVRAHVVASAPLLRVGLERAALAAGLQPARPEEAPTVIGLHSADTPPTGATVDLSVGANQVTIAVTAIPDHQTWTAVWQLLGELLDGEDRSP
jgi:hypothetical protein